jgi:hypothetical protein
MGQHRDHSKSGRPMREPTHGPDLDRAQREAAQRLQDAFPGWMVLWSYSQRSFHAYPCWQAPAGLILTDTDPERLGSAMRTAHRLPPVPGGAIADPVDVAPLAPDAAMHPAARPTDTVTSRYLSRPMLGMPPAFGTGLR